MDITSIPLKRCTKCKRDYPPTSEFFYRHKNYKDGLRSTCKLCTKAMTDSYNKQHPTIVKRSQTNYNAKHPDRSSKNSKEWRRKHPERVRANTVNRRAQMMQAKGKYTEIDITILYINQRGKCAYCGCDLNGKYHVDHIVPLSRGGTDYAENLTLTCPRCNLSKGDKLLSEWKH